MKKSTLITTIAMIVVVVVALSTATFAWFSSATEATATKSITTQASADWTLTAGRVVDFDADTSTTANVNYGGSAQNALTLSTELAAGLFAPTALLTTAVTNNNISTTVTNLPTFYVAQKQGTSNLVTAKHDTNLIKPDLIRVTNAKDNTAKDLKLNITIIAGQDQQNGANLYAAAAVRFYVGYYYSDSINGTINNAYNHKQLGAGNTVDGPGTPADESNGITTIVYQNATVDGTFTRAEDAIGNLGIAANDFYKTYEITIGKIETKESVNFVIYTWLDGWVAETEAAGASINVVYAFTTDQVYTVQP